MPKVFSDQPLFVDLFYGVVVGSAVASLSLANRDFLIFEIVWILAVLEDWYLYYRHIVDPEAKAVPYTFRSLLTEFGILVTWFLGFQALKEANQQGWFFLFFSLFYGIKIFAGVTFYARHGQLFSRRMAYDALWLIQILTAIALWYFGGRFACQFWILSTVTAMVLVCWWTLVHFRPPLASS